MTRTGNAAYYTSYENHIDWEICHQNYHKFGYILIFHIFFKYL